MAKKSVKKVVKEMNKKTSRPRTQSDDMYNYRRGLRRKLSTVIEKNFGVKLDSGASIDANAGKYKSNREVASILKEIKGSFAESRVKGEVYSKSAIARMEKSASYQGSIKRQNLAFQHQMNQATKKGGVSVLSKGAVKGFYIGTADMFRGAGDSRRFNEIIMQRFGERKLERVFNLLTDARLDDPKYLYSEENLRRFGVNTPEEMDAYLEVMEERVNLSARREAVQSEIEALERRYKTLENTDSEAFNGDDEPTKEGSPPEAVRITSRINIALNG